MKYSELIDDEKINEIMQNLPQNDSDLIFISGSLVQGVGNKYSDIDVFVLTDDISNKSISDFIEYDHGFKKTGFLNVDGINFDIEYWDMQVVLNIIERVKGLDFTNPNIRVFNLLNDSKISNNLALSLLHRIYVGIPKKNLSMFQTLIENIDFNNYFRLNILLTKVIIDNAYEDIIGNISERNYFNALKLLRECIFNCMGIELLQKKVSFDREKWIYPLYQEHFSKQESKRISKFLWKEVTVDNVQVLLSEGITYVNEILEVIDYGEEDI